MISNGFGRFWLGLTGGLGYGPGIRAWGVGPEPDANGGILSPEPWLRGPAPGDNRRHNPELAPCPVTWARSRRPGPEPETWALGPGIARDDARGPGAQARGLASTDNWPSPVRLQAK